jgi:class 3 adenylate cyclase
MDERALLFTDVVDSTALVQRLGDSQASALWAEHDRRARELLSTHDGREIDRTDGFFVLLDDIARAAPRATRPTVSCSSMDSGRRCAWCGTTSRPSATSSSATA